MDNEDHQQQLGPFITGTNGAIFICLYLPHLLTYSSNASSQYSGRVGLVEEFMEDFSCNAIIFVYVMLIGLKSHAVTLYEAGKLGHASIADLCRDLVTLESAKFEGELQEFANHAFSLRCILECLTSGGIVADARENIGSISLSKEEATSSQLINVSAEPSTERTIDENFSTTLSEESNSYAEDSKLGLSSKINEKSHCVKGPIHFGPPSHSSMTSWMKLVLYSALSSGPLSVVLMKGQCLRLLPAPLAGCEKALVWSWDGSTIGGLGGKLEGNLVKGSILLHCLNSLLKCTAVLVQPLSRYDLDDGGKVVTLDVPLPLKNSDGSMASIGEELGLCREESLKLNTLLHNISNKINLWTMGYIRLLRLFKEGESQNFSVDTEKYEWVPLSAEFEYQATGPTAKLLYQKEHQKDKDSSRELMTYASGRWNPLSDPSSPISGALSEKALLLIKSSTD
ncbi:protein FAM91A1, partial [Sesamum angolense]